MPKRKRNDGAEMAMNMTPMIDIVFQLLIFFMLISDFVKRESEPNVALPAAHMAIDDKTPEKRIIINVMKNGDIKLGLTTYKEEDALLNAIKQKNNRAMADGCIITKDGQTLSNLIVKVRADSNVEWKHVQTVIKSCMSNKIWRISIGVLPVQAMTG